MQARKGFKKLHNDRGELVHQWKVGSFYVVVYSADGSKIVFPKYSIEEYLRSLDNGPKYKWAYCCKFHCGIYDKISGVWYDSDNKDHVASTNLAGFLLPGTITPKMVKIYLERK